MALDPNDIDYDPYLAWQQAQPLQVSTGEYGPIIGTIGAQLPPTPTPPPPPPPQQLVMPGAPVADEAPLGVAPQPLSPDEEAQIEIDPRASSAPTALQPDAVSAADPHASVADLTNVSVDPYVASQSSPENEGPDAYLAHQTALANEQSLPSMRDAQIGAATDRAVNAMNPDQYARYKADREGKLLSMQAEAEHQAQLDSEQRARDDLAAQQYAVAKADADTKSVIADAQRLAAVKVNPNRYREQRGLGGTIRDIASVFLSGLGGDADGAVRMVDQRIARDIDAQNADIANGWQGINARKGAIADEYARHGDLYRAQETYRIAEYQSAINDIQTQLQLYDPAGSSAIRGRDTLDQLHGAQQQALIAFNQQQFKNHLDTVTTAINLRKQMLDEAKAGVDMEKTRAETAKLMGALGGKSKVLKFEDTPMTADQLRAQGIAVPPNVQLPPQGWSINQAKKVAETAKSVEDWQAAARVNSPEERNRQFAIGEIVDDKGDSVQFRNPDFAGKLADTKASVETGVALIDEMIKIRNESGWTSDTAKSQRWRDAQQAAAAWLLSSKNADQLGVLSGSDLELEMKKLTGGTDLTGARDPIPSLISARNHMLNDLNSKIRAQAVLPKGRKFTRWEPPNMASLKESKPLVRGETGVEQAAHKRIGALSKVSFYSDDERARRGEERADVGPTGLDVTDDKAVAQAIAIAQSKDPGDAVQRLADAASSGNASKSNAVIARVRAESPEVYKQVLAKLDPARREELQQIDAETADEKVIDGTPQFAFESLSPEDLAARAHDDAELQKLLFTKTRNGSRIEKQKAADVLRRVAGAPQ